MTHCVQSPQFSKRRNRWQDKRERQLRKLANLRRGRAAMLKDFRGLLQDIYLQAQTRKRESV